MEMTYFVGDSLNCNAGNLDDLIALMECRTLAPEGVRGAPVQLAHLSGDTVDTLGLSGYGLNFTPEYICAHRLQKAAAWEGAGQLRFGIKDIQTLYVREAESILTLKILFPRYQGTFAIV